MVQIQNLKFSSGGQDHRGIQGARTKVPGVLVPRKGLPDGHEGEQVEETELVGSVEKLATTFLDPNGRPEDIPGTIALSWSPHNSEATSSWRFSC